MLAVIILGCIAATAAAPHAGYLYGSGLNIREPRPSYGGYDPFKDDVFDTRQFWAQMAKEMREIDEMLATFSQRFPTMVSQTKTEGNEYKITIPLTGFEEKDIVVKAKEGFLMVQAVHAMPEGGERMYLDAKTLPNFVNVTGTWTFDSGVLKIVFPLKGDQNTGSETEAPQVDVTKRPVVKDREEMESDSLEDEINADVGLADKEKELFTNEIPRNRVEATTYAVDLKDEVEFVPVRHY